jgi:predicted  nucleic acid-binding Zn-ribbon protein
MPHLQSNVERACVHCGAIHHYAPAAGCRNSGCPKFDVPPFTFTLKGDPEPQTEKGPAQPKKKAVRPRIAEAVADDATEVSRSR